MTDRQNTESRVGEDEISLVEIRQFFAIFKGRFKKAALLLLVPVILLAAIGYIAAVTSPKEYDAKCILITDQLASASAGSGSGLLGLANLAGVPAPAAVQSTELGADLYPLILSNRPFLIELSKTKIYSADQKKMLTFKQIFSVPIKVNAIQALKNVIFHPSKIKTAFSQDDTVVITHATTTDTSNINTANLFFSNDALVSELTSDDKKIIGILGPRIKFTQTGKLITLSVKMPEARLSAEATTAVLNLLIKYITKFKTNKQLETLNWLEARTAEWDVKYKASQQRVAGFKDNNYHVIFESVQTKEAQLQNDFTLAASIYNQFVSQMEQAKIQLKKETPLFTVVEPVYIPDAISTDSNKLIVSYATAGFLIGLLLAISLLVKTFVRHKKAQKKSTHSEHAKTESL